MHGCPKSGSLFTPIANDVFDAQKHHFPNISQKSVRSGVFYLQILTSKTREGRSATFRVQFFFFSFFFVIFLFLFLSSLFSVFSFFLFFLFFFFFFVDEFTLLFKHSQQFFVGST